MTFGLLAFGSALGDVTPLSDVVAQYSDDEQRILGYGYRNVVRCPDETGITDLAVRAGAAALESAAIEPTDVDLLVLAITDIAEHLYWDAAASVAYRLGITGEAVLLTQACTTGVLSLDTVAGKFATHPAYRTALVVTANRTCDAYWNRLDTQPMVFSDGAAAAVARRDHPRLRWLATEVISDGRYADLYRLDAGGAAVPFGTAGATGDALRARDAWSVLEFLDYDAEAFERFAAMVDERTREVVAACCARVGSTVDELVRLVLLSDNAPGMTALAKSWGIPLARTNVDLALEYGHLGAADQLFCLGHYVAAGELTEGDRVGLVSRGRGMHWACTILEA